MAGRPYDVILIDDDEDPIDMSNSVRAVEAILNYSFKDKKLLEQALTHPSYTKSESYQRLEFVGDAALGSAISNFVYLAYPELDPGDLSVIRSANISTEKLARVAVTNGLHKYVRHNVTSLDDKVKEFCEIVEEEDNTVLHGGAMKAPKVLADIVESVIAAVYIDLRFDLQAMWLVIRGLLEPMITLDMLEQQPQPVSMLFKVCQKDGQQVDFKHSRKDGKNIASVYIGGKFIVSASSEQKENAKLRAARAALEKLEQHNGKTDIYNSLNGNGDIEDAKQKLHQVCLKKKWPKPSYSISKEVGPAHARKFACSVSFETKDGLIYVEGEEKFRVKDAEGSAASLMLHCLRENNYL